ncbi:MAG: ATP-binding protein [Chitinophagaceae bacterium]
MAKNLQLKYDAVTAQIRDSVLKNTVLPSLQLGKKAAAPSQTFKLLTKPESHPKKIPSGATFRPVLHLQTSSNTAAGKSSYSIHHGDTSVMDLMEGVQISINAAIPDSLNRLLNIQDTIAIRKHFNQTLSEEGKHFQLRWQKDSAVVATSEIVLHNLQNAEFPFVSVSSFKPFLFSKILPQLSFSLILILISALAFLLAWKSYSRERRLSAMKNNLMSNISHELRTPTTTIKILLDSLAEDEVLQNQNLAREYIEMATQDLERLELLINQTLHNSLLESGKLKIQLSSLDLRVVISELLKSLQPKFQRHNVKIEQFFEGEDFFIRGDSLHVQGVFLNVLDNAVKYGGENVHIKLKGRVELKEVIIEVIDNGPGIEKAYQKSIFGNFVRVPSGNPDNVRGYGLGLSYAAQIVQLHGGSIMLSDNRNGSCTFILKFPQEIQ